MPRLKKQDPVSRGAANCSAARGGGCGEHPAAPAAVVETYLAALRGAAGSSAAGAALCSAALCSGRSGSGNATSSAADAAGSSGEQHCAPQRPFRCSPLLPTAPHCPRGASRRCPPLPWWKRALTVSHPPYITVSLTIHTNNLKARFHHGSGRLASRRGGRGEAAEALRPKKTTQLDAFGRLASRRGDRCVEVAALRAEITTQLHAFGRLASRRCPSAALHCLAN